jgi:hypothetical protein
MSMSTLRTITNIVDTYYSNNLFLLEDLMELTSADIETFELSIFNVVPLSSNIYNYPQFQVGENDRKSDIIEFYHSTSNPQYKLFQMLVNHFKRKNIDTYWLGSPIFFGQL